MHQLDMHVERTRDLPDRAHWQMVEASVELRRQEAARARAYEERQKLLQGEYSAQIRSMIIHTHNGPKKLEKYLAFRKAHLASLRAAKQQVVPTQRSQKEFDDVRRRLVDKSRAFMKQLGIDGAQIGRLQKDLQTRSEAVFDDTFGQGEVTLETLPKKMKNTTFTPPFNGTLVSVSSFKFKEEADDILPDPSISTVASHATGEVGATSSVSVTDASDKDVAEALCNTTLLQWFKMPNIGQVTVKCTFEIIAAFRFSSIEDEFGNSSIKMRQRVRFFTQVFSPVVSQQVFWQAPTWEGFDPTTVPLNPIGWMYDDHDDDDHTVLWTWGAAGATKSALDIVIPGVFAKNTWVLVGVGVGHRNRFESNDCGVMGVQSGRFLMKSIGISATT